MADTPGALPTLGDGTTVKFKLGMLLTGAGGMLCFAVWLTTMYNTQTLTAARLERIEADVREIKGDIKSMRGLGSLP